MSRRYWCFCYMLDRCQTSCPHWALIDMNLFAILLASWVQIWQLQPGSIIALWGQVSDYSRRYPKYNSEVYLFVMRWTDLMLYFLNKCLSEMMATLNFVSGMHCHVVGSRVVLRHLNIRQWYFRLVFSFHLVDNCPILAFIITFVMNYIKAL